MYIFCINILGRTIFEGLLTNNPKRLDLWSVYIDMNIKAHAQKGDLNVVRQLLQRCTTLGLKPHKMKFFFKRYLDFEKKFGDDVTMQGVRDLARSFVEGLAK